MLLKSIIWPSVAKKLIERIERTELINRMLVQIGV
jgi:hypothetical protein